MTQQGNDWLAQQLRNTEFRRLFEQELLVESMLAPLEQARQDQGLTLEEWAQRAQCSVERLQEILTDSHVATVVEIASLAVAVGKQLIVQVVPLTKREHNHE
jgi:NAD-specific glutamate dehydrogenase